MHRIINLGGSSPTRSDSASAFGLKFCPDLDPSHPTCISEGGLRFLVRARAGFFPETHNFHRVIPRCTLVEGLMDKFLSLVN